MDTVVLNVKGMTCTGCVRSIKNVLEPISGVDSVDISLDVGKVTISYDPTKANPTLFKSAIEDAGYDVTG